VTVRQRVLRAIDHEPVDRLPVLTYNFHPFSAGHWRSDASGRFVGPPRYQALMDTVRRTGAGMLCKVSSARTSRRADRMRSETRTVGDTSVRTTRLPTPKGELSSVYEAVAGRPGYYVKHFVETEEDLGRYESLPPDEVSIDLNAVLETVERLGDSGIGYLSYPDPMYEVASAFDFELFCIQCAVDLPRIVALVEREHVRIVTELAAMLEQARGVTLLFYTAGPEVLTPPMASPSLFEALVVPYERELVSMIRTWGQRASIHCHGRTAAVFDGVLDIGPDVLEPLEPPPQGDIRLEDALTRADGRLCIMGYIQDQDLYTANPGEMTAKVREIRRTVGGRTGYIMTSSASPFLADPPDRYLANYTELLEAAADG